MKNKKTIDELQCLLEALQHRSPNRVHFKKDQVNGKTYALCVDKDGNTYLLSQYLEPEILDIVLRTILNTDFTNSVLYN